MMEEIKGRGKMLGSLNSTFIALIPKFDITCNFGDFRPISLCNMLYKIVVKIITMRLNPFLSNSISTKKFGFLRDIHIHEVVVVSQGTLHSINIRNQASFVIKIDLSKAYDKDSHTFLQLLLLHVGFSYQATKWIMSCVTSLQFAVLINGCASNFFSSSRELRQG